MRHRVAGRRLHRDGNARKQLRRNLMASLFLHDAIQTTEAKAKMIQGEAEHLIALARSGTEHHRRLVLARLGGNEQATAKLCDLIAPEFEDTPGGFTRLFKLGHRRGDGADLALLQIIGREREA
jgi:large subunit ribosomal protein L17